jgi:hypothetical protein
MKTNKWNWMIDAALLAGLLATFFLDLTGLVVHQWLGVALGLLAGYHFVSHWNWVKSVTRRFVGQTSRQARSYYVLDAGLMLGFALTLATGLVISSWLSLPLGNYAVWSNVHVTASIVTLLIVVVKIGLHWRWIVKTAQQLFAPTTPTVASRPMQPVPVSASMDRRSFLALMGVVSIASVVAIKSVLDDTSVLAETAVSGTTLSEASQVKQTTSASSSSNTAVASSCVVRCNKGCSYPGHCRRYVDTNGNKRCDLGECL